MTILCATNNAVKMADTALAQLTCLTGTCYKWRKHGEFTNELHKIKRVLCFALSIDRTNNYKFCAFRRVGHNCGVTVVEFEKCLC